MASEQDPRLEQLRSFLSEVESTQGVERDDVEQATQFIDRLDLDDIPEHLKVEEEEEPL